MKKRRGRKKIPWCLPPLFKTKADVIEPNSVGIKTFATRSEHSNNLRNEVDYLTELRFLLADPVFRPLALGNVLDRSEHVTSLPARVPFPIPLTLRDPHSPRWPDHP